MRQRRARRNPSGGMGIDTNSALLGAAVGAGIMYMLTKKDNAPGAMAYLPAEAPSNEPWMRAMGYKKGPGRVDYPNRNPWGGIVAVESPALTTGNSFQIDAKVYDNSGKIDSYLITLVRRNGELDVVDVSIFINGIMYPRYDIPVFQSAFRAMQSTGRDDQPFGSAGRRIKFGQLRSVTLESDRLQVQNPNPVPPLQRPSMRSPLSPSKLRARY